jgi:hypothetical protein
MGAGAVPAPWSLSRTFDLVRTTLDERLMGQLRWMRCSTFTARLTQRKHGIRE